MSSEAVLVAEALIEDVEPLNSKALRPLRLAEYEGQSKLIRQLSLAISASNGREDAMDHVLFSGPPGLGKTTLSQIMATELGVNIVVTSGPVLERPGDLAAILTQLGPRDVLFIDEIHRLAPHIEEVLYPAMEDYSIDILLGEGELTRSITVPLSPFTLIGATTRSGSLSAPLRDRFGIIGRMEYYTANELSSIILRSARLLGMELDNAASLLLANCSRGTPRIANRLLRRVRDLHQVERSFEASISEGTIKEVLKMLEISEEGLDALDQRYLYSLYNDFQGGPVGLDTLSVSLSEARETLEDAVEPFLIQKGLLQRTPRGRVLSDSGKSLVESLLP